MMLIDALVELLEVDIDNLNDDVYVQGIRFALNKTHKEKFLRLKMNRDDILDIFVLLSQSVIYINNDYSPSITIPKEELEQSDENYLILKHGKILTKGIS